MLKQLLENRIVNRHNFGLTFQHHIYELQNCEDVLGLEAKWLQIENSDVAVGYIVGNRLFFKSMGFGRTDITLTNGIHEAIVQLAVMPSGEISVEVKPFIGSSKIVNVYFRTILGDTVIAIDLKGALKNYLVAHQFMNNEDNIVEVHYQSKHPNVLQHSVAGNFVLGSRPDGGAITNAEEYTLANKIANLQFSKIVIQQHGMKKVISLKMLLTFVISNRIFVSNELPYVNMN